MRRRWRGLLGGVVVLAWALGGAATASAGPAPPLGHEGRWLTDSQGRVVILHGVNQVNKLERQGYLPKAKGFGRDDAELLAREGFNTVRTGLIHKGFERSPGRYDNAYLEGVVDTVEVLEDAGHYVLFDFHQDMYNERFNGEGLPDWAVVQDAATLPAQPDLGFPANYLVMPALQRAYDHFWANASDARGRPLQEAYAEAWRRVAERLRERRMVFGYDIFNEPFPGTTWETCANPLGCPLFDQQMLTPFSKRVIEAIRREDRSTLVFYEPNLTFNNGADTHHGDTGDPRAGMSFHVYCIAQTPGLPQPPRKDECELGEQQVLDNADAHSDETGDALINTEFGATDDLEDIERVVEVFDRNEMGWQYWSYFNEDVCCERHEEGIIRDPAKPPTPDNLKQEKLDVLVRAYPQAVAGTPRSFDFDREQRRFDLSYSTRRAGGGSVPARALTEVFVPRRHYGADYRVRVEGAEVASRRGAEVLRLRNCPRAERVTVAVSDEAHAPTPTCAEAARGPSGGASDGGESRRVAGGGGGGLRAGRSAGAADTGGGAGGSLPFTGFLALAAAAAGLLAVSGGAALRRASRPRWRAAPDRMRQAERTTGDPGAPA
jgi:endoglycosylceramidase